MKTVLMFSQLEFNPGTTEYTFRCGLKYKNMLSIGNTIGLSKIFGEDDATVNVRLASVEAMWVGKFGDIPQDLLDLEHAAECKHREGLRDVLTAVYGKLCTDETVVVGIGFKARA